MDKKRILVVDDDSAVGEMLKTGLEVLGYSVELAATVAQVWPSVEKSKPDAILMDIGMPGLDGISLCRNIRLNKDLGHVPIIMVTAFSDAKTFHDAMLFGADDFLTKPFEISEVQRKIEDSLAKRINKKGNI